MKRGVWVKRVEPKSGEFCDACNTRNRWLLVRGVGAFAYLCTRHLHQLARSAMRASVRERLARKRRKR